MSATTVPGEALPVAVPALLVVVAAALATVAVSLVVPVVEAERSAGAGASNRAAVAIDVGTAPASGQATPAFGQAAPASGSSGTPLPSAPASAGEPPSGEPAQRGAASAPSTSPVALGAPGCLPIRVAFGTGQAMPSPTAAARLRELGARLVEHPKSTVVIDGHADSLGSEDLNLRLSKRRAEAVAWVLENAGVPKASITSRGFGAYSPVEGAGDDAEANRRVAIHVRGTCVTGFEEALEP